MLHEGYVDVASLLVEPARGPVRVDQLEALGEPVVLASVDRVEDDERHLLVGASVA